MAENIPTRPHRDRGTTPALADELPEAPYHLSEHSSAIWREIVTSWVVGPEALPLLRTGLESLDRHDKARIQLDREGLTITHPTTGLVRAHPCVKISVDSLSAFRQAFRQLGLTPPEV